MLAHAPCRGDFVVTMVRACYDTGDQKGPAAMPHEPNAAGKRAPNRLLRETSPYLKQHAYNPVDWFPWSPEALAQPLCTPE